MIHSMILAAALAANAQAPSTDWRLAATGGESPQRMAYFVEEASVRRDGDSVRFWTQTVMESPLDESDWDRSVTLRQGSCRDGSSAIVQNSYYYRGRFLETTRSGERPIVHQPGSMMEGVLDIVCGRADYLSASTPDPEAVARAGFGGKD